MKILIDKSFEKDLKKITDQKILNSLAECIEGARAAKGLSELKNHRKLKGSTNAFRIRIGNYRVGLIYENRTLIFIRFLHRSKIYNSFP